MYRILCCLCLLVVQALPLAAANDVKTVQGLVGRLLPDYAKYFEFRQSKAGKDVFAIYSRRGKVVIEGNNANSMAVGLNYYLKRYCLTTISWYKDDPVEMPATLPVVPQRVEIAARMPMRFFLNYCTYGYTMPWWTWEDWERFIDWMALNGVNMPLAITGAETPWYNVWRQFGLTDEEIREFFGGPAFLGWHRMCNFDGFMGPLPMSWMERQEALQKKIVARERAFNMRPVLPAFAGHIPAALLKRYPTLQATPVSYWGGFKDPERHRCTFLYATDPMYAKIQRAFIREQTRLYGTDHIYGIDPFNEVDPPSLHPDSLSMLARGIYQSVADVDPQAVWLQMGWTFKHMPYWTNERQRALFRGVPQDRLIMLDYWCENKEMWPKCESYFGQPFLWCYLNNFGGRNRLVAPTDRIFDRIDNVAAQGGTGFKGVGATLEAFDVNMFGFELLLEKAWNIPESLSEWRDNLADRRMGRRDEVARKAYHDYCARVLDVPRGYDRTLLESRPQMKADAVEKPNPARMAEINVWRQLMQLRGNKDMYRLDVVNVGRQCLADYFYVLWRKFVLAYELYDLGEMQAIGKEMKEVIADAARLTACHPVFSMRRWIDTARQWGDTQEEKAYYERNARRLLTLWVDNLGDINDYAGRPWDGLIQTFYAHRWALFIDTAIGCVAQGKRFDDKAFTQQCYTFEERFCELDIPMLYPPKGDAMTLSRQLYNKYFGENHR